MYGFLTKWIRLLIKVSKVATRNQNCPTMGQNSIMIFCLPWRAKKASVEDRSPPQEQEVGPHSGQYLPVIITRDSQNCLKAIPLTSLPYQTSLQDIKVFKRPSICLVKMTHKNVSLKIPVKIFCQNVSLKCLILYHLYFLYLHPTSIIYHPSSIIIHTSSIIHHPSSIIHQFILYVLSVLSSISHPSSMHTFWTFCTFIQNPSSIIHHSSSVIRQFSVVAALSVLYVLSALSVLSVL